MKIEEIIKILNETKEKTKIHIEKLVNEAVDEKFPEEDREREKQLRNITNKYVLEEFYNDLLIAFLKKEIGNDNW